MKWPLLGCFLGAAAALCPPLAPVVRLTGADLYLPESVGPNDVLIGGGEILAIAPALDASSLGAVAQTVDLSGLLLVPGLVDVHVHAAGGGGEAGPSSRTPEAPLSDLINAGVTSLVALRGTDDVSRSAADLLAKVRALTDDGLTAYMHTGGYRVPTATLTHPLNEDGVRGDIMWVNEIVGVGEVAVSDHRSSEPSLDELKRLAADARVAGLLAGKAGTMYCHMGSFEAGIDPLIQIVEETPVPITNIVPTHMTRTDHLIEQGRTWLGMGGRLDMTAGTHRSAGAVLSYWKSGLPLDQVSVSSDAYGSLPSFDSQGQLVGYNMSSPSENLNLVRQVVRLGMPLEDMLPLVTANAADSFLLPKGRVAVGADADLVALDPDTLEVQYVFSKGELMKTPTWTKKSLFEPGSHACS